MTYKQELFAQIKANIQKIQDIADGYKELARQTDRILATQNNNQIPRSRAEARGYNG